MDHVDDHAVLDLVLLAGQQFGGGAGVGVRVAGARCGAGQRVRPQGGAAHLHQQFGRGADEPVHAVAVAAAEHRLQAEQDGVHVDRVVAADLHLAGDDGLGQVPVADGVACRGDRGQVVVDRGEGTGGELLGAGDRCGSGDDLGRGIVDGGDPPPPVRGLADDDARDDQFAGRAAFERVDADGQRGDAADAVVVIDRGEEGGDVGQRDPGGDPTAGEAGAVADEQVPVAGGDAVEIRVGVGDVGEGPGDGAHAQSLVPTISWVSPPDNWWCSASRKPAVRSIATISSRGGR